jgi:hypothetical protein
MTDLFGFAEPRAEFKDIRNQRPSTAEEKAELCATLNTLLRRSPKPATVASIEQTRHFKHVHKTALKVLQNKASSRQELRSAINSISAFTGEPA